MSEFKNRLASNINRKKYFVEENTIERNECGEVISFVAKEVRYDNPNKDNEGTPLNASTLNTIISEMIETKIKKALENYYENGLAELENVEVYVFPDASSTSFSSFGIDVVEPVTVTIENDYQEYFSVSISNSSSSTIGVEIAAKELPDDEETTELDFVIKLFSQATGEMIKKVTCSVIFQLPSLTPED